ncbi:serine/threonine protein phosphatase [Acetobacteraceae bacterium H6797]|nr:serine/threonine protein phosphatase [Acetobacteraceae bacterium H6797]
MTNNSSIAPALLPEGLRVYAIGDVHGCSGLLFALHRLIAQDAAARPATRMVLLHLGDYVDRGPDSAAVIARLLGPSPVAGMECVSLLGNHDAMMRDALAPGASDAAVRAWLANGGNETLRSYGASARDRGSWGRIPEPHRRFLAERPLIWSAGGYAFVHAGLRPGLPLAAQTEQDMLWIRQPFLSARPEALPLVVVHGHTPALRPEILRHRIGIDTGAVYGGSLTCLVLEGGCYRLLSVGGPG